MAYTPFKDQKNLQTVSDANSFTLANSDFPNITKIQSTGKYVMTSGANPSSSDYNIANAQKYDIIYYDNQNNLKRSPKTLKAEMVAAGYTPLGICVKAPVNGTGVMVSLSSFETASLYPQNMRDWVISNLLRANTSSSNGKTLTQSFYNKWVENGSVKCTAKNSFYQNVSFSPAGAAAYEFSAGPIGTGNWYLPTYWELKSIFKDIDPYCFEGLVGNYVKIRAIDYIPVSDFSGWGNTTEPNQVYVGIENWSNTFMESWGYSGLRVINANWDSTNEEFHAYSSKEDSNGEFISIKANKDNESTGLISVYDNQAQKVLPFANFTIN